jgi:hypothetical protein
VRVVGTTRLKRRRNRNGWTHVHLPSDCRAQALPIPCFMLSLCHTIDAGCAGCRCRAFHRLAKTRTSAPHNPARLITGAVAGLPVECDASVFLQVVLMRSQPHPPIDSIALQICGRNGESGDLVLLKSESDPVRYAPLKSACPLVLLLYLRDCLPPPAYGPSSRDSAVGGIPSWSDRHVHCRSEAPALVEHTRASHIPAAAQHLCPSAVRHCAHVPTHARRTQLHGQQM